MAQAINREADIKISGKNPGKIFYCPEALSFTVKTTEDGVKSCYVCIISPIKFKKDNEFNGSIPILAGFVMKTLQNPSIDFGIEIEFTVTLYKVAKMCVTSPVFSKAFSFPFDLQWIKPAKKSESSTTKM